jgi:hypothetical protein
MGVSLSVAELLAVDLRSGYPCSEKRSEPRRTITQNFLPRASLPAIRADVFHYPLTALLRSEVKRGIAAVVRQRQHFSK